MEPRHLLEETHDHDHSHPYEHDHSTIIDLTEIKKDLRNSNLRLGKRRDLQTATGYKFQVDMYIEVDFDLCAKHGEACTNGVGPKTLNYINAVFAGANTVFEVSSNESLREVSGTKSCMHLLIPLPSPSAFALCPTERDRYTPERTACCREFELCILYGYRRGPS